MASRTQHSFLPVLHGQAKMSISSHSSNRNVRIAILTLILATILLLISWKPPVKIPSSWRSLLQQNHTELQCDGWPDPGNIAIAVKTGATEAVRRIPMQMQTSLRCAKSVVIFSDLQQKILKYDLHDALDTIPDSVMEGNSDFLFYDQLKEAERYGQIEEMLGNAHDPRIESDLAAWTLDKYKQLHIIERLYQAHPDKEWYMMMDADTYPIWSNLLRWLQLLPDPMTYAQYYGSPATVGEINFAHGGSGVLLSHAAIQQFAQEEFADAWDARMHEECCGDLIIGTALKELDIILKPSWPTINGEKPLTLPFGEDHWCQPVVTLHHVTPDEMNQLEEMQRSRNDTRPLTFADLFDAFVRDILPADLNDWDNLSKGPSEAVDSYDHCKQACEEDNECFQFSFNKQQCYLGHSIHLGRAKPTEADGTNWHSGWLLERIYTWADSQPPCNPQFPWT